MPENETWTLKLTPAGGPVTTLTALRRNETFAILRGMLYGG
jgi:hypothetical protein